MLSLMEIVLFVIKEIKGNKLLFHSEHFFGDFFALIYCISVVDNVLLPHASKTNLTVFLVIYLLKMKLKSEKKNYTLGHFQAQGCCLTRAR